MDFPELEPLGEFHRSIVELIGDCTRAIRDQALATLISWENEQTAGLELVPANPNASRLHVILDYPTLTFGNSEAGETGEMFGSDDEILVELRQIIADVIAGRVEVGLYEERGLLGLGKVGITYVKVGDPDDPSYWSTRGPEGSGYVPFVKNFEPY